MCDFALCVNKWLQKCTTFLAKTWNTPHRGTQARPRRRDVRDLFNISRKTSSAALGFRVNSVISRIYAKHAGKNADNGFMRFKLLTGVVAYARLYTLPGIRGARGGHLRGCGIFPALFHILAGSFTLFSSRCCARRIFDALPL
jgi:hypothetical protein